jgi:hypothetical protein
MQGIKITTNILMKKVVIALSSLGLGERTG